MKLLSHHWKKVDEQSREPDASLTSKLCEPEGEQKVALEEQQASEEFLWHRDVVVETELVHETWTLNARHPPLSNTRIHIHLRQPAYHVFCSTTEPEFWI